MKPKFKIGDISIDEDGVFWVQWMGNHAQQGGIAFSPGNMGMDSAEGVMKIAGRDMDKNKEIYLQRIKDLEQREALRTLPENNPN